jgi:hypothetical protein
MGFAAGDLAQRAGMDAAYQLDERRRFADLESDIQTDASLGAFAGFDGAQGSGHVHAHGLFAINMLAGGHRGSQVPGMEIGRRGDDDGIHFGGVENLLGGARALKHLRGGHAGVCCLLATSSKCFLAVTRRSSNRSARATMRAGPLMAMLVASTVPRPPQPSRPTRTAELAWEPRTSCGFTIMKPAAAGRWRGMRGGPD